MDLNRTPSNGAKPVQVTVLGTGDAFASGGRAQSGYLIDAGGWRIMLEAGPALLEMLKRDGIATSSLDMMVISHLHGDHFAGLPFLVLEYMYESPRKRPFVVVGPRNLEQRTWTLMRTMFPHFDLAKIQRKIKWVVIEPEQTVRVGKVKVSAIRSPHTKPDISLSIKIEVGGKTVVFSGDTGWNDELVQFAEGADLFLCECTYFESSQLTFHLNYPQLEVNRDKFHVRRMVLTHLGREVLNREPEVRIEMGFDGMKIDL